MRLLYGPHFEARYAAIAAEIGPGATVIEVCAGDCYLYRHYLQQKSVKYLGLDLSPQFVAWSQARGVTAREFNLWQERIPPGEIIVMQASLYQFLPAAREIVEKLLTAASQKVIIAEPIRNLADSNYRFLAQFSRWLTRPNRTHTDYEGQHFNEQTLTGLFQSFAAFERILPTPGKRELVGVFRGQRKTP